VADNNFRSHRSREASAPDLANPAGREGASDPLAELARLIGQADPYGEDPHDAQDGPHAGADAAAAEFDWETNEGERAHHDEVVERRQAAPPAPAPGPRRSPNRAYAPDQRAHENQAAAAPARYFSGSAAKFNGFHQEPEAAGAREQTQALPPRRISASAGHGQEAQETEPEGGEVYSPDDYYDEPPDRRRRSGLLVVVAVLGLAVVGTAGAFAYRAMFGGSLLPTLPPIIKASNGPNKIVPSAGESQTSHSAQTGPASAGSSENLVSREEQPVDIEPAKPAPRVVSTIPMTPGQSPSPSDTSAPFAPASAASAPMAVSPTPAWLGGNASAPMQPPPPAPIPSTAAPVSPEPKKIHTVTIHADQAGSDAAPSTSAAVPSPSPRGAARQGSSAKVGAAGSSAPLAITPGTGGDAAAPAPPAARAHSAGAPLSVATAAPATGASAPPSGGSYAVQVSSQHSETEAQSSFQELRAKFPNLLGAREPIIRRADLGAKGIYYRALVGPFGSAEEAAAMCSNLKAAGGNCIVQKN
jgi:SPOR domain